ncbi:MAG: hypothetical protein KIT09_04805 [Bryobacteraceae bacterium]|nr:hypothetical protein [Bryobacteraceae bacterium]
MADTLLAMTRTSLAIPIFCLTLFPPSSRCADDPNGASATPNGLPAAGIAPIIPIAPRPVVGREDQAVRWRPVMRETGLLFGISQGFRLATQAETREALKGPYFKDYIQSLKGLGGWGDDDPPLANYVAHPMQGSTTTWIVVQNDPRGRPLEFQMSKPYWTSRFKGLGFSAAYSAFYELSPVGDAAIGNLGMRPEYKGMVDLVITPTVGLGWHLTEDMLDRYVVQWVEQQTGNTVVNAMVRTWLNPTRSFANILRFQRPWERDSRRNLRYIREQHQLRLSLPSGG